ncbi:MAG: metallophosphoesterase [Clostridiales bacterium]|nr:metallophosphoesterase [Clostridiales bacterium]
MEKTKHKRTWIKWTIYWGIVLFVYITLSAIFGNFVLYALLLLLAAAYFALRLLFAPFVQLIPSRIIKLALYIILDCLILGGLVGVCFVIVESGTSYNNSYIASLDYTRFAHTSSYRYDHETGVYTVTSENEDLKILQLTDVHLCGSINTIGTDRKAIDACYTLIEEAQPDLIIVTGDIVYPIPIQTFNSNNLIPVDQFCTFMNKVGIPWMMVYGNHDTELVADYDEKSLSSLFRHYKGEGAPMLYAEKQPDIYGRYSQYLRIENRDGSLNRVLFLIDSNDYVQDSSEINDYDSVHDDQIQWYSDTIDELSKAEGSTISSFVFMHIPFRAFADAQEALRTGNPDAVYLFGENGEGVSCPARDSGFFDTILSKGSTQAVFVGHDHLNNMAVNYKGIDLVYSKSIDYIAYPRIANETAQRGATLITLHEDKTYEMKQIDYAK